MASLEIVKKYYKNLYKRKKKIIIESMSDSANTESNVPIFGRKIFFIAPPTNLHPYCTSKLRENEYEVYTIKEARLAKGVIRNNPDSIVFCNIDDNKFSTKGWFNYLKSFQEDDVLKNCKIGVLSSRSRSVDKKKFLEEANLSAGYITTSVGNSELMNSIKEMLDLNGAKGKRQYVRANTADNPTAQVVCEKNNQMLTMQLLDISSVGFACKVDNVSAGFFVKNSLLKNFTLRMGRQQIVSTALIFAVKPGDEFSTLVLLFVPALLLPQGKKAIQDFCAETLEKTTFANSGVEDTEDYEHLYDETKS